MIKTNHANELIDNAHRAVVELWKRIHEQTQGGRVAPPDPAAWVPVIDKTREQVAPVGECFATAAQLAADPDCTHVGEIGNAAGHSLHDAACVLANVLVRDLLLGVPIAEAWQAPDDLVEILEAERNGARAAVLTGYAALPDLEAEALPQSIDDLDDDERAALGMHRGLGCDILAVLAGEQYGLTLTEVGGKLPHNRRQISDTCNALRGAGLVDCSGHAKPQVITERGKHVHNLPR